MQIKLWDHQEKAISLFSFMNCLAIFFDTGTGKSLTVIMIIKNITGRIIILCPLALTNSWAKEFNKYAPELISNVLILTGPVKERVKILKKSNAKIIITNYEALTPKSELTKELMKLNVELIICDESQKLKKYNGARFKAVSKISKKIKRRIILSGTPINDRKDIWSQYYLLDDGETFGKNYTSFLAEYFYDINAGRKRSLSYFPIYTFRQNKLDQYSKKMLSKACVAKKEECIWLPEHLKIEVPFEMDTTNRKIYDELEESFVADLIDAFSYDLDDDLDLESSIVSTDLIITKMGKLLQLCSGFCIDDNGNTVIISSTRRTILKELIDSIPQSAKIIVWCNFKQQYKDVLAVCEELEIECVEVHGGVSHRKQQENLELFENDQDVGVLIANAKSIGCGVNLQCSSYSIYYGFGWSLEERLQSEARNYRAGSKNKVTHYYILSENSIETEIHQTLLKKEKFSLEVFKKWNLKK